MSKLDAIENVSPKELVVPEFQKREIEEICKKVISSAPGVVTVEQIGTIGIYAHGDGNGAVSFLTSPKEYEKIKKAKILIFAMNGTFVMTPLAQNGDTLALGSFATNEQGDTSVARLRFRFGGDVFTVFFNESFDSAMSITPYAVLFVMNY